jgi:hypothetical protein
MSNKWRLQVLPNAKLRYVYVHHTARGGGRLRVESTESHIQAGLTINCPICNFISLVAADGGKYTN